MILLRDFMVFFGIGSKEFYHVGCLAVLTYLINCNKL